MSEDVYTINTDNPIHSPNLGNQGEENALYRYRNFRLAKGIGLRGIIYNSLQEILSAYIEPIIKQWIKNIHLSVLIILALAQKFKRIDKIPVPRKVSGLYLEEKDRLILSKGLETDLIQGFTSKGGKPFKAYLKLDEKGKIQYRFPNSNDPVKSEEGRESNSILKAPDPIPRTLLGVELSEEVRQCLKKGIESPLVLGLKSRKGNVFNAYLRMNMNGELKFRFPNRLDRESGLEDSSLKPTYLEKDPSILKRDMPNEMETKKNLFHPNPHSDNSSEEVPKIRDIPIKAISENALQNNIIINPYPPETMKNITTHDPIPMPRNLPSFPESHLKQIPEIIFGQKLYNITIKTLEAGKESELIKGFISPSGKVFDAYLKLIPPNHIQFRIPSREKDLKITSIPKIILGVTLTEQNKSILKLGYETPLISNFQFSNGKPFKAFLRRDEKGSLIIRTPPSIKQIPLSQSM